MNKKKNILTIIVAIAMFCMMSMSALADSDVHISLPENKVWTSSLAISRTGMFSYVWAGCDAVYPSSGSDHYTKIQTRLVNSSGTLIMTKDYETLTEGDVVTPLYIKEGYLSYNTVYIQFRGNTNAAAEAIVEYFSF